MALIKCPECGKEVSSQVKKCPSCGYKIKKTSKKTIIILSVVLALIVLISVASVIIVNHNNKIEEQKRLEEQERLKLEYQELLNETGVKIYIGGLSSQIHCYNIGKVWYNSIFEISDSRYNEYTKNYSWGGSFNDFSTSIANYLKAEAESLTNLKNSKTEISENIKKLKNVPSEEYQEVYDKLVELYGVYSKLVDMAYNPSGTYSNYISNYHSYSSEFESVYNQLIVLSPEIKEEVNNSES